MNCQASNEHIIERINCSESLRQDRIKLHSWNFSALCNSDPVYLPPEYYMADPYALNWFENQLLGHYKA